jgi:hypothetical protein
MPPQPASNRSTDTAHTSRTTLRTCGVSQNIPAAIARSTKRAPQSLGERHERHERHERAVDGSRGDLLLAEIRSRAYRT